MENPFVAIKSIASPGRKKRTVSKHILKKDMNGKEEKKNEDKQKIKEVKRKRKIKKIHRKNSDAIPERKKGKKIKTTHKVNQSNCHNESSPYPSL